MVSDLVYDQLNDIRRHKGQKRSFNTVIQALIGYLLKDDQGSQMYIKLQWHAIRNMMKKLESDGYLDVDLMQYSHVMRMLFNRQYDDAKEYIDGQFNANQRQPLPPTKIGK